MTVATDFYDWQRSPIPPASAPYDKCSPNLVSLQKYMMKRWGGKSLGCFSNRNIKGGDVPSSHAYGAARDWRWEDPGPGRARLLAEVIPFLIENSAQLGIQAIHDYVGCRIWRANRSGDANGGWKKQEPGSQMGQSWAKWLHIEVNKRQWADGRSVEEKLSPTPPVPPVPPVPPIPPFDPANGKFSLWPLVPNKPRLSRGSTGDAVRYLQGVLKKERYTIAVDGNYGAQTETIVKRFQARERLVKDGIVAKQTWAAIDKAAGG